MSPPLRAAALVAAAATIGAAGIGAAAAPAAAATTIGVKPLALSTGPGAPRARVPFQVTAQPAPAALGVYVWRLDGARLPVSVGAPWHRVVAATPGTHVVSVRIAVGGVTYAGALTVHVLPAILEPAAPARHAASHSPPPRPVPGTVAARLASDPGVSIVDFAFSPGTTTIHVGDTVTWTNTGKQPHSATANGNSFNTGILEPGGSASHTFTKPGTYTYFCLVHPFMHGTIVVLAAATTTPKPTTSTHTTSTPARTTPAATNASSGSSLPMTGMDELAAVLAGAGLLGVGLMLRAAARTRARSSRSGPAGGA